MLYFEKLIVLYNIFLSKKNELNSLKGLFVFNKIIFFSFLTLKSLSMLIINTLI